MIKHTEQSYHMAAEGLSKLSQKILDLPGMSGAYTRHFYNNLGSMPGARYLEIGTWSGSTIASAMYGNEMECVAVDNWSEFGGPKDEFMKVFDTYKGKNDATFYESDCWSPSLIEMLKPKKFNIYVYDGHHSQQAQYDALIKYLPCMDDTFIFVVDDWNTQEARRGTLLALKDSGVDVLWRNQTRLTWDNSHTEMGLAKRTWWNGVGVFVLSKPNTSE